MRHETHLPAATTSFLDLLAILFDARTDSTPASVFFQARDAACALSKFLSLHNFIYSD
jgi:hypothetical protein